MTHGWQTEPTDGPKGGWSCVFFLSGCNGCSGHLTHNCWMSCGVVVVVVYWSCSCSVISVVYCRVVYSSVVKCSVV